MLLEILASIKSLMRPAEDRSVEAIRSREVGNADVKSDNIGIPIWSAAVPSGQQQILRRDHVTVFAVHVG
jgi:hypothetical protein